MAAEKLTLNTSRVTKNELYMNYTSAIPLKRKMSKELTKIHNTLLKLNKTLNKAVSDETVKGNATWAKTIKTAATNCSNQAKYAESKRMRLDAKFDRDSELFVGEVLGGKYQQVDQSINELGQTTDSSTASDSPTASTSSYSGDTLTSSKGRIQGPSGEETYYNLNMNGVVNNMRNLGYSEEEYPYWVREDGAKMLGDHVMVAADLNTRPKGTILNTSLGSGIVCDTGDFAKTNPSQIDIATNWS